MVAVLAAAPAAGDDGANDPGERERLEREVRALREEIAGRALLRDLALIPAQASALLPLARRAAALGRAHEEAEARLRVEFEAALRDFRAEDMRDRGFSPTVERKAGGLEHRMKELRRESAEAVNAIEREAETLLTPGQRLTVETAGPARRLPVPPRPKEGSLRGGPEVLERLLELRRMPDAAFRREREKLVVRILSEVAKRGPFAGPGAAPGPVGSDTGEAARERDRIGAVLDRIRGMTEGEIEERCLEIVEEFRPRTEAAEASRRLREIRKGQYGEVGPLGRMLSQPVAAALLEEIAARGRPAEAAGRSD